VVDAAATAALPGFGSPASDVNIPGIEHSGQWIARIDPSGDSLFQTLGIRLLRGRAISRADVENARRVAVINETMVRSFFGGSDPIGRSLMLAGFSRTDPFEVVGVSSDVKNFGPQLPTSPMAYVPYTTAPRWAGAVLVRTSMQPTALITPVRRQLWTVVPNLAVDVQTVDQARQRIMYETPEFGVATMGAVATMGLLLVALGVFSVMAYAVSLRTQEFGIRMALGADSRDILRMIMANGLKLVAAGALVGTVVALAAGRVIESQLFGVSATDFAHFGAVVAVILLVGVTACLLAARRAMTMDPLDALRSE
jgi:putative ABC transport system permease protein